MWVPPQRYMFGVCVYNFAWSVKCPIGAELEPSKCQPTQPINDQIQKTTQIKAKLSGSQKMKTLMQQNIFVLNFVLFLILVTN